jgi:hypothetical protein
MKMKLKIIYSVLILVVTTGSAWAQNSTVVLSDLHVRPVMDPSANALNTFMIDLKISDPSLLKSIIFSMEDDLNPTGNSTQSFTIAIEDQKPVLKFEDYSIPIEQQTLQIFLKVRDQLTSPYQRIVVKGRDASGNFTNELLYNREH